MKKQEIQYPLLAKDEHWKHWEYNQEKVVPIIKECIEFGYGQNRICHRLNELGIATSTGHPFLQPNLHRLMKSFDLYTQFSQSNPANQPQQQIGDSV